MIVLNSLFPIFVLLLLGRVLKSRGLTNNEFLKTADRLIYFFFFPVMFFWKIGGASFAGGIDWMFITGGIASFLAMFLFSTIVICMCGVTSYQAGSFSQSCYRFNTYIGVAVVLNSLGAEGLKYLGLLLGFVVPLVNFFAVAVLIWFSGEKLKFEQRFLITVRAILSNPLIAGCVAGIIYSRVIGHFPVFIDNSLNLISMAALPLALISVGGSLTFSGVRGNLRLSFIGAALKLFFLPLFGYGLFHIFGVTGVPFSVGMILLALPTSTAIYVLSSQLHSDTELASSTIVVSTLLSFVSLSVVLLL